MPNAYNILRYEETPYFFTFTTDSGVLYGCYFGVVPNTSPLLNIYNLEIRDFVFEPRYPIPAFKKLPDPRVQDTITVLMSEYFSNPTHVLLYAMIRMVR